MYISCWNVIYSPKLDTYTMLLKSFGGNMFYLHGIITSLPINLGDNIVSISVEVIDSPLDYNLLLMRTWFYEMNTIVSLVFRVLRFHHQGKIVTIDQLALCTLDPGSNKGSSVLFLGDTHQSYMHVGVGMVKHTSLMGFFPSPTISYCNYGSYQHDFISYQWIIL
jgi:hypothetical protein